MTAPDPARTRPVWLDEFLLASAPSVFFQANADADARLVEVARLRRDNRMLRAQADGLAQSYERVCDERDEAKVRQQELNDSLNDARAEVVRLTAALAQERLLESWHGIAAGGQS
jgi:hypothetical protein